VTASRCPSKLDHRVSSTVLWCTQGRGHGGLHLSGDVLWADDDERAIQGGDACCAGEWGYASPVDMHTEDCPEYLARAAAQNARRGAGQDVVYVNPPVGVRVTLALTRRQANAILAAELSVGHGVRRSRDLVAAERRLMEAVRAGVDAAAGGS
jgi:hypothetical protein